MRGVTASIVNKFLGEERMAKKSIWSERYIALEIGQSYEIIANYK